MGNNFSLSDRILSWLKRHSDQWINGGEFERMAMDAGYKGSTASRELRLLAEAGRIERKEEALHEKGVRSVWYRHTGYSPQNNADRAELEMVKRRWPEKVADYVNMMKVWNSIP